MQKKYIFSIIIIVAITIIYFLFFNNSESDSGVKEIEVKVEKGKFNIKISGKFVAEIFIRSPPLVMSPQQTNEIFERAASKISHIF